MKRNYENFPHGEGQDLGCPRLADRTKLKHPFQFVQSHLNENRYWQQPPEGFRYEIHHS